MIDGAHPVNECGDRVIVGDVDDLGDDIGVAVGVREFCLIASGHGHPRAFRPRQQSDGARYPAAPPQHHDPLVPQRNTHRARTPQVSWCFKNWDG